MKARSPRPARPAAGLDDDLIVRRGRTVAFVEVKWRASEVGRDLAIDAWRLRRVAAGDTTYEEVLRATQGQPVQEAYRTLRGGGLPTYRAMLTSNDAKEGPIAFGEKRPPRWSGT